MDEEIEVEIPFNHLPLPKRFNLILKHNKTLIAKNDLLEQYSRALEYQIKELERSIKKNEFLSTIPYGPSLPERKVKEVIVRVQAPDTIGETIILKKEISKLVNNYENLNSRCSKLFNQVDSKNNELIKIRAENKAMKKVLEHRRR